MNLHTPNDERVSSVPAVKRIHLTDVGCWKNLYMTFIPGLNLITGMSGAVGKTTIFRVIRQSLSPAPPSIPPLSPRAGSSVGKVSVELWSATCRSVLHRAKDTTANPRAGESYGLRALRQIKARLRIASPGSALLVDDEIFSALDAKSLSAMLAAMLAAPCQVICQTNRPVDITKLPDARVYACRFDESGASRMTLLQSGKSSRTRIRRRARK